MLFNNLVDDCDFLSIGPNGMHQGFNSWDHGRSAKLKANAPEEVQLFFTVASISEM